ncbi:MAG: TraB/GumN family protein [Hyphomonadaceae bacterium]|nr:TraB/GumN family protein [Hyphomonadaceae bacterium]
MRAVLAALLAGFALAGCAPAPAAQDEPALWRIADADSEIWLFGSVHLLPPDLDWRGPRLDAAFAGADEFVTETDTSAAAVEAFAAFSARYGALPAGETLAAKLDAGEAEALVRHARNLGLPIAAIDRQRPWLTALQLSLAYAMRAGHRPEAGVEAVLIREARTRGMRLSFLESPEQQVRVLADLSEAEQLRFLRATLHDLERGSAAMAVLDRAWAEGDVAALEAALDAEWADAGPAIRDAILIERNRDWAGQIERRLAGSGRIFIAVGAAHLVGEDSVIDLLRERGVAVDGP